MADEKPTTPAPTTPPAAAPAPAGTPAATPPAPKTGGFDLGGMFSNPITWLIMLGGGAAGYALGGSWIWAAIAGIGGAVIYGALGTDKKDEEKKKQEETAKQNTEKTRGEISKALEARKETLSTDAVKKFTEEQTKALEEANGNKAKTEAVKKALEERVNATETAKKYAEAVAKNPAATDEQKKLAAAQVKQAEEAIEVLGPKFVEAHTQSLKITSENAKKLAPATGTLATKETFQKTAEAKALLEAAQTEAKTFDEVAKKFGLSDAMLTPTIAANTALIADLALATDVHTKHAAEWKAKDPAGFNGAKIENLPLTITVGALPYGTGTKKPDNLQSTPLLNQLQLSMDKDGMKQKNNKAAAMGKAELDTATQNHKSMWNSFSDAQNLALIEISKKNRPAFLSTILAEPDSITSAPIYFARKFATDGKHKDGLVELSGHYEGGDYVLDSATFFAKDKSKSYTIPLAGKGKNGANLKLVGYKQNNDGRDVVNMDAANRIVIDQVIDLGVASPEVSALIGGSNAPTEAFIRAGLPRNDVSGAYISSAAPLIPTGQTTTSEFTMTINRNGRDETVTVELSGTQNDATGIYTPSKALVKQINPLTGLSEKIAELPINAEGKGFAFERTKEGFMLKPDNLAPLSGMIKDGLNSDSVKAGKTYSLQQLADSQMASDAAKKKKAETETALPAVVGFGFIPGVTPSVPPIPSTPTPPK